MNNSTLKILIVEDDISFSLELEMILDEIGYQILATVDNSAEALDVIFSKEPDLILMDIDIKGSLTGTEIGQKIKHLNIPIIYITSFDDKEKYDEARQSNLAAYLIKPTNRFTIESTIDLIIKKRDEVQEESKKTVFEASIFVKRNKTYYKVSLKDIQCVEASGNYSTLYIGKNKFISNLNLKEIETMLTTDIFMKTHRSYIMNINYFSSINTEENTITMENNKVIPISRANKQSLLERMKMG